MIQILILIFIASFVGCQEGISPQIVPQANNLNAQQAKVEEMIKTLTQESKQLPMPEPIVVNNERPSHAEVNRREPQPLETADQFPDIQEPINMGDVEYPEETLETEFGQELPEWVLEEETKTSMMPSLQVQQSFSFLVEPGKDGEKLFKWDPSKEKILLMEVYVYVVTDVGELSIPTSSNKRDEVEIFTKKHEHSTYYHLGEVYVHSIISINFDSDYRILRFRNTYEQTVLVEIDLEFSGNVIEKALDDDDLLKTQQKIKQLMKKMETTEVKREHSQKIEHGFLSKQNAHEQVLLVLTGCQLLGVLIAALVQIGLIKGLLENRQIV